MASAKLKWPGYAASYYQISTTAIHTSENGLTEIIERLALHTDPMQNVTYEITRQHQRQVVDWLADAWEAEGYRFSEPGIVVKMARSIGVLAPDESGTRLDEIRLDDASDDYDFVQPDDGGLAFRALDRAQRTDTWLSNEQELRFAPKLDPWDPDTDDDGLTDGQELKWMSKVDWGYNERTNRAVLAASPDWTASFDTQPWDVDSDGDGYWDGWLGVYGAENSSNVVLYMEHLVDEDSGVQGDEVVAEQAGVHLKKATPSAMGADIYGNDTKYHSNIHIGELQWGTHPVDRADKPAPGLTIEVDFHNQSTQGLWRQDASGSLVSSWADRIEANYALYGIRVDLQPDEVIEDDELPPNRLTDPAPVTTPFSIGELATVDAVYHQTPDTQYFFVANSTESVLLGTRQTGANFYVLGNALFETLPANLNPQGMFVFTENDPHGLAAQKTAVNEIANSCSLMTSPSSNLPPSCVYPPP